MPRRFPKSPFACDASPDIVAQTGRSIKHSLLYEYRMNNKLDGVDLSCSAELAGPPGDVGFAKWEGAVSYTLPLSPTPSVDGVSLHFSFHSGFVKPLRFGGLCRDSLCVSDRFFVGGPLQLRGFHPSGIGPRADTGGSLVAGGGDSLGGELFYTSMLAASAPFPFNTTMKEAGLRFMCFVNTGTLSGWGVPVTSLIRSTRASVGTGVTLSTSMGKLEATYSIPLRYGPRDIRQQAQFGFGFVIGG
jgi:outer membrane protein insertion porin family